MASGGYLWAYACFEGGELVLYWLGKPGDKKLTRIKRELIGNYEDLFDACLESEGWKRV
jgi:hypothetical protein